MSSSLNLRAAWFQYFYATVIESSISRILSDTTTAMSMHGALCEQSTYYANHCKGIDTTVSKWLTLKMVLQVSGGTGTRATLTYAYPAWMVKVLGLVVACAFGGMII